MRWIRSTSSAPRFRPRNTIRLPEPTRLRTVATRCLYQTLHHEATDSTTFMPYGYFSDFDGFWRASTALDGRLCTLYIVRPEFCGADSGWWEGLIVGLMT